MPFLKKENAIQFFSLINTQHDKINFTMEDKIMEKIPFFNIFFWKNKIDNTFKIATYRKNTHAEIGINFTSFFNS